MRPEELSAQTSLATTSARASARAAVTAVALFAAMSIYCAIRSQGFIAADACTHYLAAKFAFQNPINFVDVWNRPLVTALFALPAQFGGRTAVRLLCLCIAIGCGLVGQGMAKGQGLKWPVLALFFTLGQPLVFLHSFGEMTELPFALVLGLAFLAWQKEKFWLAAVLVSWTPLARPEGFGFVFIAAMGLLLYRRWRLLPLLPIPIVLWDLAGWTISHHAHPWWRWLPDSWPYSQQSLYGRGYLLTFVALLPSVVSPLVLPATLVGIWKSIQAWRRAAPARWADGGAVRWTNDAITQSPDNAGARAAKFDSLRPHDGADARNGASARLVDGPPTVSVHLRACIALTALLPLFVLIVHSLLYRFGKMASFGEARYLLVVSPFWGVLAARGWEWIAGRLRWRHPLRWAGAAALAPLVLNAVHPIVPIALSHDWQSAREFAGWYEARPRGLSAAPLIASHPGIFYFLGVNPHDSDLGSGALRNSPPGTVLIWDPIFSATNASADCILTLDEIHKSGWEEIAVPRRYEPLTDGASWPKNPQDDAGRYWHVFVNPKR